MRIEWSHISKMYRREDDQKFQSEFAYDTEPRTGLLDFSATAHRGITAVLGPRGAGKSTLLSLTAARSIPNDGRVTYRTVDNEVFVWSRNCVTLAGSQAMDSLRARIGYVPQRKRLEHDVTVEDALVVTAQSRRVSGPRRRAMEMIVKWGLAAYRRRPLSQLSGAVLNRYLLAHSLVADPLIWLLDEPADRLDDLGRELLCEELIHHPPHRLTLIATHDLELAECADEILLMEKGACRRMGKRNLLTAGVSDGSVASWYQMMQTFAPLRYEPGGTGSV